MPSPKPSWMLFGGVIAVALGLTATDLWAPESVRSQIRQTVSRRSTPFTELYFTNPSSLPKRLPPQSHTGFEFTIVNHERSVTTYHYIVSGHTPAASLPIASGDITLPVSTSTSLLVSSLPAELGPDYVVTVHLADRVETIHFAIRS